MITNAEFDRFFRLYYDALYRYAHQYIPDTEDCLDIVSATFEDVWRNASTLRKETVKAYLYTSARNRVIDFLRKQQKRQRYLQYVEYMSKEAIEEDNFAESDANQFAINKVMRQLKPPTNVILRACYLEGKKYKEVAEEMDMSVSNVKKHIMKALKIIREAKKTLKR
jgi:RNA polymerase sigma-70 factor (family 1)